MSMKKFGAGEILPDEETPIAKEAAAQWTEDDEQDLAEEGID